MKTFLSLLLLAALLIQGIAGAEDAEVLRDPVAATLKNLSEKDQKKLDEGKVIFVSRSEKTDEGADAGIGWAIGIINATPDVVWAVLEDYKNYPDYMPRVEAIESYELEGDDEQFGLKFTLGILFRDLVYHIKQRNEAENHTITWEKDLDFADDFTKNNGQWILRSYEENKTLAFYTVDIATNRFIPKALQNFLLKRDLPDVIEALRQEVETDGAFTKE
jgi:carbon monoxide dehydrogenase subunit G